MRSRAASGGTYSQSTLLHSSRRVEVSALCAEYALCVRKCVCACVRARVFVFVCVYVCVCVCVV